MQVIHEQMLNNSSVNEQHDMSCLQTLFWPADVQFEAVLNQKSFFTGTVCDHKTWFMRHN